MRDIDLSFPGRASGDLVPSAIAELQPGDILTIDQASQPWGIRTPGGILVGRLSRRSQQAMPNAPGGAEVMSSLRGTPASPYLSTEGACAGSGGKSWCPSSYSPGEQERLSSPVRSQCGHPEISPTIYWRRSISLVGLILWDTGSCRDPIAGWNRAARMSETIVADSGDLNEVPAERDRAFLHGTRGQPGQDSGGTHTHSNQRPQGRNIHGLGGSQAFDEGSAGWSRRPVRRMDCLNQSQCQRRGPGQTGHHPLQRREPRPWRGETPHNHHRLQQARPHQSHRH